MLETSVRASSLHDRPAGCGAAAHFLPERHQFCGGGAAAIIASKQQLAHCHARGPIVHRPAAAAASAAAAVQGVCQAWNTLAPCTTVFASVFISAEIIRFQGLRLNFQRRSQRSHPPTVLDNALEPKNQPHHATPAPELALTLLMAL